MWRGDHADNQSVGEIGPQDKSGEEQVKSTLEVSPETRCLPAGYNKNAQEAELGYA